MDYTIITASQIKLIHTIKSAIKISDEDYRAILSGFGVSSSKNLNFNSAKELINKLECIGIVNGVWVKEVKSQSNSPQRFENLGKRGNKATPKQLRMLESIWSEVSRQTGLAKKQNSFNHFLSTRFNIDRLEWIDRFMVGKIKKTLETMKLQGECK